MIGSECSSSGWLSGVMMEQECVDSDECRVPIYCCGPEPCTRSVDMSLIPLHLAHVKRPRQDDRDANAMHCIPKSMSAMSAANGFSSSSVPLRATYDLRDGALSSYHATRGVVAVLTLEASRPQGPRLTPSSLELGKPPLWDIFSEREGGMFLICLERCEFPGSDGSGIWRGISGCITACIPRL